jgi:hypothetical protein
MNDDLILLASAYLDGDVSADERAQVDTDPELLAEVERLRAVRVLIGETDEPKISVREAHLAAAFGVWDRLPEAERTGRSRDATPTDGAGAAAAASVRAPTSLRDRRRATSTRWLSGAAAALVLVVAGAVVVRFAGSTDSDDSADSSSAELAESSTGAAESTDAAGAFAAADEGGDGAVAESGADAAADEDVQLDTGIGDPPPPPEQQLLQQLFTPQDLADFAAPALGAPQAPDVPAATSAPVESELAPSAIGVELPLCLSVDIVVGPALYGDTLVVVGVDEGRNLALAYVGETCTEIARVELDRP